MIPSQKEILSLLERNQGLTFAEMGKILRKPSNRLTLRVHELVQAGLVCRSDEKRKCTATNIKAWEWRIVNRP